jgi:uncharacterized protein (DUF1778 family)
MKKNNLTIRITDEARQILQESARSLGLSLSSFVELAIRAAAKQLDQQYAVKMQ